MKKGFTLVEMMLSLSILVIFCGLLVPMSSLRLEYSRPLGSIQIEAMQTMKRTFINETKWFNHNGNINQSGWIDYDNKRCLIYLGYGRFHCE